LDSRIDGVEVRPLKIFSDERGSVFHMLRRDSAHFTEFGEIYFSSVRPEMTKGWKRHTRMTLNLAVPIGRVRFSVFDDRVNSETIGLTSSVILGPGDEYSLLTVSPMLWLAFENIGDQDALVANCPNMPHMPDEADNRSLNDPRMPKG